MYRTLYHLLLATPFALQSFVTPLFAVEERIPGFSSGDTLTIRASEAWMDEQPDIMHFSGGFELRANDWYLSSDQATLYGNVDDPETVILTGAPAVILIDAVVLGHPSPVNGEARQITYQRNSNTIVMQGDASLSRDGHTLNGGEIRYNIGNDLLSAGGLGGVHIKVLPEK